MRKSKFFDDMGDPTGLSLILMMAGFFAFFILAVSWAVSEDTISKVDIPGTNCEVVEYKNNNLWFTPGESTVTSKIKCTTVTTIDKVDIGR